VLVEARGKDDAVLFARSAAAGGQQFPVHWGGDCNSTYESMAESLRGGLSLGLSGFGFWSHDIGGHMPGAVEPELFTRWVQFGEFSPILRTHTTKNTDSERRIWAYPEPYSAVLRAAFQQRYALQPYIYTEARRTYDTGVAFFRPLYYDWPEANEAYTSKGEYLFGEQMLVAPVVSPADKVSGLSAESVWLPKGEWIEWPTGKHFTGPVGVERKFSIEQVPVYVKAGAIVPMQPPMEYTGEKPVDPLIVNVWPLEPGASSSYAVYEDSGVAEEYKRGVFARTPIKAEQKGDTLRVEIGPVEGGYAGMLKTRSYELRLPDDWPPEAVTVNGTPINREAASRRPGWSFRGNTLTTVVPVAAQSVEARVVIEVRRAAGLTARRGELDGFAGAMTRLRGAYDALYKTGPIAGPSDALIDPMQTGDRLSYFPEHAVEEIARFHTLLPKAQESVDATGKNFDAKIEDFVAHFNRDWLVQNPDIEGQKKVRRDAMARAKALADEAQK